MWHVKCLRVCGCRFKQIHQMMMTMMAMEWWDIKETIFTLLASTSTTTTATISISAFVRFLFPFAFKIVCFSFCLSSVFLVRFQKTLKEVMHNVCEASSFRKLLCLSLEYISQMEEWLTDASSRLFFYVIGSCTRCITDMTNVHMYSQHRYVCVYVHRGIWGGKYVFIVAWH